MRTRIGSIVYALLFLGAAIGLLLPWLDLTGVILYGTHGLGGKLLLAVLLSLLAVLSSLFVPLIRRHVDVISLVLGLVLFAGTLYRFVARFMLIYERSMESGARDVSQEAAEQATAFGLGVPLALIALNAVVLVAIGRIVYHYLRKPS